MSGLGGLGRGVGLGDGGGWGGGSVGLGGVGGFGRGMRGALPGKRGRGGRRGWNIWRGIMRGGVGREEEGVDGGLREWAVREGVVGETTGLLVGLEGKSGEENRKERVVVVGRRSGYSLRGCRRDVDDNEVQEEEENGDIDAPQKEIEADDDADVDADVEDDTDAEAEEDDVALDDS